MRAGAGGRSGAAPPPSLRHRLLRLLPFVCLYVSFGSTLGFLTGGAPLILRVRGVELAQVGLAQAINLPLGLTFLWAGLVDRWRLPGPPHRIGWIFLMQGVSVAALLLLAAGERAPLPVLLLLGLLTSFAVATMDIALEALVVETVTDSDRAAISTAKFCGASLGGMFGNGLVIGSYDRLGWPTAVGAVALVAAATALPMLRYPERRLRRPEALVERPAGRAGRLRALASRVLGLGAYFAALHVITGSNGLALIDLGLPLATVGAVSGGLAPFINLVMALLSGLLLRRFGTVPLVTWFAGGLVLATALMTVATATGAGTLGLAATVLAYTCSSGLGVPVFTMLYRWAEGPRAATDYAVLFGAAFFASMPVRVAAPAAAAALGWPLYFAVAIALYAAAVIHLRAVIARTEARAAAP